jgi:hypothetical protein
MAKVFGPLLSLSGGGTIGKTLTFQRRPSGFSAFLRKTPYDPKSTAQLSIRAYITQAGAYWRSLGAPYQAQWNAFVV